MPNLLEALDKTDWQTFRFDEIAQNISKRVEPGSTDLTVYVGLEHIDSGSLHIKRTGTPADVDGTKLLVYKGDVIFGRRRAYQRKAAVATFDGICSAHALVLRAKPDVIDPRLLPFFLHSDAFMHRAIDISVGGLSPTINWGSLKVEEFRLPPRELQAQLADLLWAADEVGEQYLQLADLLDNVVAKLIETEIMHGDWEYKSISEIADVAYGISDAVAGNKDPELGCPILTGANINLDGSLATDTLVYYKVPTQDRFLLKYGDLLLNWRSGSPQHIGKTAFFDRDEVMTYASFILRIRAKENFNPRYGFYILNYLRAVEYFTKDIAQQVNFKMNAQVFREVTIPVPPIGVQNDFVAKVESITVEKENTLVANRRTYDTRQEISAFIFSA